MRSQSWLEDDDQIMKRRERERAIEQKVGPGDERAGGARGRDQGGGGGDGAISEPLHGVG